MKFTKLKNWFSPAIKIASVPCREIPYPSNYKDIINTSQFREAIQNYSDYWEMLGYKKEQIMPFVIRHSVFLSLMDEFFIKTETQYDRNSNMIFSYGAVNVLAIPDRFFVLL